MKRNGTSSLSQPLPSFQQAQDTNPPADFGPRTARGWWVGVCGLPRKERKWRGAKSKLARECKGGNRPSYHHGQSTSFPSTNRTRSLALRRQWGLWRASGKWLTSRKEGDRRGSGTMGTTGNGRGRTSVLENDIDSTFHR
jgi:hypothetical protein